MRLRWTLALVGLCAAHTALAAPTAALVDTSAKLFKEMTWRSVGPANMGGRISDIAVVEKTPTTIYLATGTGGLFKTTNNGTTWSGIFDDQAVASIGAVTVWQKNPNVVWVGTGEANSRNSSSWGNGVYRSLDGGGSWEHMGLAATSTISQVLIDPGDSNTVYVAALGRLWGENAERGVFKTTDGGKTWSHVLRVDARTGACDLAMDPGNPRTLYAALYARRRTPWSYTAGGTTGGIFRSTDGGATWAKLTNGLPASTGRIGLDVFRKNPRTVYAVVESDDGGRHAEFSSWSSGGGVFRSLDGGDSWTRLSEFTPRPFYFSEIRVQPDTTARVYLLGVDLWVSDDGGKSFTTGFAKSIHPDCHAMWIDPSNVQRVLLGTDGGFYQSYDRARTWDFHNNLAIGEFYNVAVDMREPYFIYGGLQDNQSWGGPSATRWAPDTFGEAKPNGITNADWFDLGGGDGFHVAADPSDPNYVYFESQGGELARVNLATGKMRYLRPSNNEGQPRFRFNWNAPFVISPHDSTVLWMGGNHVFRLTERGDEWERVSPDLTTQNPERMITGGSDAETHCTITSLAESPVAKGRLWAGTDDGKVWTSPDGASTWTDCTARIRGVPPGLYVSRVEASHHDARTAYVSFDGHRTDVFAPYVVVTRDGGASWTSVAGDLPRAEPVKVIREGRWNPRLLFVGTEFGIYRSLDGGAHWVKMKNGLPTVAVDDIVIHPRDGDLVIGTHGRSVYVMDDIVALERWTPACARDSVTLFPLRPATAFHARVLGGLWGERMFSANNPPFGAYITYFVNTEIEDGVKIEVADSTGTVRKLTGPGTRGVHRVVWDLQPERERRMDRTVWVDQPAYCAPGEYTVTLTYGDKRAPLKQTLLVKYAEGTADN